MPFSQRDKTFRLLAANPFIGVTVNSLNGSFLYANSAFCEMVGYSLEEILQMDISELYFPEDKADFKEFNLQQNNSFQLVKRYHTKQQTAVWCEINASKSYTDSGEFEYYFCFITNISKLKGAETILKSHLEKCEINSADQKDRNKIIQNLYTELEESEEKYKLAFKTSPDSINITKMNGVYVDINEGFTHVTGFTREDVIGLSSLDLKIWNKPEDRLKLIEGLTNKGIVENLEAEFRCKDGSILTSLMSARIIKIKGEPHILSITRDITQRKIMEEKLIQSEEIFRSFLEYSPIYVFFKDSEARPVMLSRNFEQMLGMTIENALGKTMNELFPSDLAQKMVEDDLCIIKENKAIKVVEELNNRIFETTKFPILKDGKPVALAGFTIDITERKHTEQALKKSEENLRIVIDASKMGTWDWNILTSRLNWSDSCKTMFGIPLDTGMTYDHFLDALHPDDREPANTKTWFSLNEKIDYSTEYRVIWPDGSMHWISALGCGFYNENGIPIRMMGVAMDITERKNNEKELVKAKDKAEESDRLKSAFLANMSHEIRTPMNAIKGFAQLLEDADLSHDKRCKYSKIINQRTDDLLTLINDLLDIAKIEAGQLSIVENHDDLNNLLFEIFQFFKSQQDNGYSKHVTLTYSNELTPAQSLVSADFFRLRQILINLVNNALKFTSEGFVTFGCKLQNNHTLLFYIEDSGIGIPKDKYELVFEPFRQINESYLSKRHGGTGLGLSIVKGLVELMNGTIWIESVVHVGTKVFFTILYNPTNVSSKDNNSIITGNFNWNEKTILIVEDDEFNMQLIIEFLAKTDVHILSAINAEQALEQVSSVKCIDMILMDIQLPDINGYELTPTLKKISPGSKVIAQTAYASENDRKRALDCGCDDYISKPLNHEQLLKMIHKYLI